MKLQSNSLAAFAAALALFASIPLPAVAEVTEAQIVAARTPADHQAIAKSYEADAATAEAMASKHEAMVRHCERLVTSYTDAAADYRALAAEHRSMAQDAAK